jgi:3-oxoacyl-[acyl-carrier protein] reductase
MKPLSDRVAIVTGGADGVGLGIARVLAAECARVAILDIDGAAAEDSAAGVDGDAIGLGADVRRRTEVGDAVRQVVERWGRVDILAANAGIYPSVPIADIDDELFDNVLGVNLRGAINAIQACLPSMREQAYGRIVLSSSITGLLVGAPGYALYGSTKAALVGFMRSAALEFAPHGITINAVNPGNVRTSGFAELDPAYQREMIDAIPMRRLAEPEEVGWAVRFLASEEAGYITGQTLVLDGGQVLPEGGA